MMIDATPAFTALVSWFHATGDVVSLKQRLA
jgi:hypothetical protein